MIDSTTTNGAANTMSPAVAAKTNPVRGALQSDDRTPANKNTAANGSIGAFARKARPSKEPTRAPSRLRAECLVLSITPEMANTSADTRRSGVTIPSGVYCNVHHRNVDQPSEIVAHSGTPLAARTSSCMSSANAAAARTKISRLIR